jgi:hypothetical protein
MGKLLPSPQERTSSLPHTIKKVWNFVVHTIAVKRRKVAPPPPGPRIGLVLAPRPPARSRKPSVWRFAFSSRKVNLLSLAPSDEEDSQLRGSPRHLLGHAGVSRVGSMRDGWSNFSYYSSRSGGAKA